MDTILKFLLLFIVGVGITLAFATWYFKFLVAKMITRNLSDIDYLVETGKINPKYNSKIVDKIAHRNNNIYEIVTECRRKRDIKRIKKMLSFVKQNGFMNNEDKFSYSAEIEDILADIINN